MKKIITIAVLIFLWITFTVYAQNTESIIPDITAPDTEKRSVQAIPETVIMPWDTFKYLWNQAKSPTAKRTETFAYEKAVYTGNAKIEKEKYIIRFQADIHISKFESGENLIPFLSNQLNLESLTVDGLQSVWTEKNGYFHTLISDHGNHIIQAKFTVVLDARKLPRILSLPLPEIPLSEIILNVPDTDIEAKFDQGAAADTIPTEYGTRIHGYIPAVSSVNIRWLKQNEEKRETPLKMGAVIYSYISLEEKGANCQSEIAFRILQGETNLFQILVPDTIDILDVSSAENSGVISQWFTEESDKGRMIHIYAAYLQKENFRIRLTYERTETKSEYLFSAPHLLPQSVERYENLIAVGSEANVEINESEGKEIDRGDVRFLPEEIKKIAKGDALFYCKTLNEDFSLQFQVKSHEKAPMATTRD